MSAKPCWARQSSACFSSMPAGGCNDGLLETPRPPETITPASPRFTALSDCEYPSTLVNASDLISTFVAVPDLLASASGLGNERARIVAMTGLPEQTDFSKTLPSY